MVIWHVETDYIAIAIYIVLFIKAALLNKRKDLTDKVFSLSLALGILATAIDIWSSVMMNELMGWWPYEISMIVYGLSVPVLALFWFMYTVSLIYREEEMKARGFIIAFSIIYVAYAALIVTNPIHELYFHLTPEMEYSRGVLFIPLIVWSQTALGALGALMVLFNRRRISSRPIFYLLLLLYAVTAGVYYVQIDHPGWLIVDAVYAVAFLICDAAFESQRRDSLYRTITASLEQLQQDKERELVYQKQLEEAVREANQANQAKSEFLSRMSHDIRTPINGIRGMLEIIRRERRDEARVDDCLGKIETASGHLLSLINDVLDMSKLESGQIVLSNDPFDLRQLLWECDSVLSPVAADSGIRLEHDSIEEAILHPHLLGSPLHLRQILLNLVGNAIKYNKEGGLVRCSFRELECDGQTALCRFTIEDTGIGIGPEFLPSLFQPFSQENSGSRTQYGGTGLGLAIVKRLVDSMGGEITVQSEQGVGSIFTVTVPLALDPSPHAGADRPAEDAAPADLTGVRLLLAEDNALNLEIAQFILESAGAVVDTALNGREAVDSFRGSPPDTYRAVLMDVMMPEMDGLDATRAIRALPRPDAARVPIIAMTANAFSEDAARCLEAGMNAHLAKPLDSAALLRTLGRHLAAV